MNISKDKGKTFLPERLDQSHQHRQFAATETHRRRVPVESRWLWTPCVLGEGTVDAILEASYNDVKLREK